MKVPLLDISEPAKWPEELRRTVKELRPVFYAWEQDHPDKSAADYDRAMSQLGNALTPFSIRGHHFTRLTEDEAATIRTLGLRTLSSDLVADRMSAQVARRALTADQAERLLMTGQFRDRNRQGKMWFCFYPPPAREGGVRGFLEHWGGEALYNFNLGDAELGAVLRSIGRPALVQAQVPVRCLQHSIGMACAVYRADLASYGIETKEASHRFEGYSIVDLGPDFIEQVVLYPDDEFVRISGCREWSWTPS